MESTFIGFIQFKVGSSGGPWTFDGLTKGDEFLDTLSDKIYFHD